MTARYEGGSTGRMATRPLYAASAGLITALISSAHGKSVTTLKKLTFATPTVLIYSDTEGVDNLALHGSTSSY
eukprot:COSAG01_NODE_570_length_15328_cov_82.520783_4_plen_73_part_00